jgi:hypothetical protein
VVLCQPASLAFSRLCSDGNIHLSCSVDLNIILYIFGYRVCSRHLILYSVSNNDGGLLAESC